MSNRILNFFIVFFIAASAFGQASTYKICSNTSVKSQGRTGTCWSFSTLSFLESEVLRIKEQSVDLSEMWVVRKIYMAKAEKYLRYHGKSNFSQGSLAHDVFNVAEQYGLMPESAYDGRIDDNAPHNHSDLEKELKTFLDGQLGTAIDPHWKIAFDAILDKHLGGVPAVFQVNGKEFNAISYRDELGIVPRDYVGITSFKYRPFYSSMIVEVPDNFSNGTYYNVPLKTLIQESKSAIEKGFSLEWDGDVSEATFNRKTGEAHMGNTVVTEEQRQMWFDDHTTTDDHLMHVVGVKGEGEELSFWIKNSWGTDHGTDGYLSMDYAYYAAKTVSIYMHQESSKQFRVRIDSNFIVSF
jgi:bleomycin hydrolase